VIHDPALLERLGAFGPERFDGEVFRATRRSLDPLAASTSGGRWAPKGVVPVLYTSLLREGALAEISYHWSQLTPPPSRPTVLHRLGVSASDDYGFCAPILRCWTSTWSSIKASTIAALKKSGLLSPS
jgi:hypothetical protein